MSDLDDFLTASHDEADTTMGVKSMVCNGETFNVVWNDYRADITGGIGGIEPQSTGTAVAQPADVSAPKAMIGKRCTIGGTAYRVLDVSIGDVAITFSVCDPDENK